MRWVLLLWLAVTFSLVQAQGYVAIFRRYHPTTRVQSFPPSAPAAAFTLHDCRIQQLLVTRRYFEAAAARLSLDVQGLLAVRQLSRLRESSIQGQCDCESSSTLTTPTLTPTPTPALPASFPEAGTSWQLEPTERDDHTSGGSTADGASASSHSGSFVTSTMFALAVFFMVVPVACILGFVLFCKRRRRQQHTHA